MSMRSPPRDRGCGKVFVAHRCMTGHDRYTCCGRKAERVRVLSKDEFWALAASGRDDEMCNSCRRSLMP
jgi:hypothetical protein